MALSEVYEFVPCGTPLALSTGMRSLLEQVYEYRRLLARCRSDAGLEMAEIQELAGLEAQLVTTLGHPNTIDLVATVRGGKADDRVRLVAIGPSTMALAASPYVEAGTKVEVVVDDEEHGLSYRFKAIAISLDDDAHDLFRIGLELLGSPILLRRRLRTAELVAEAA